jgi:hypothetical protein
MPVTLYFLRSRPRSTRISLNPLRWSPRRQGTRDLVVDSCVLLVSRLEWSAVMLRS